MDKLIELREFAETLLKSGCLTPQEYSKVVELADKIFEAGKDEGLLAYEEPLVGEDL